MNSEKETWICVAAVATAHGVRGALKLRCFTERPEDVAAYGPLFDQQGRRLFSLTIVSVAKDGAIAKAEGIDDRNAAEALRGTELFIPRSALPEPNEDEFYYSDLEGLDVVDAEGAHLGTVRQVVNHGAGDLIEMQNDQGQLQIFPFDKATVPIIDLDNRRLQVVPRPEVLVESEA